MSAFYVSKLRTHIARWQAERLLRRCAPTLYLAPGVENVSPERLDVRPNVVLQQGTVPIFSSRSLACGDEAAADRHILASVIIGDDVILHAGRMSGQGGVSVTERLSASGVSPPLPLSSRAS